MKKTFAVRSISPEGLLDLIAPKRVIQDDFVTDKQDLAKDELFHLNEPF